MTRLFRHGRTETVRSLSSESCAFVRKFSEAKFRDGVKSAADRKELVAMLRAATDVHQQKYRCVQWCCCTGEVERACRGIAC